jgi:N-acetylmuramoyl-L-alanine amidase
VGGLDANGKAQDNFTIQQMDTLFYLVVTMTKAFPKAAIKGHRDFSPDLNHDGQITPDEWMKECPCFDVNLWWQAVFKTM